MSGICGRVAVVTGGTSGLGEAIARRFVAAAARVVIVGRDAERGERVASEISAAGECAYVGADIGSEDCGERIRDGVAAAGFEAPTILVNNAGNFAFEPTLEVTLDGFREAVDVNLRGPLLVTQALLPGMAAARFGRVVFISSMAASFGVAMTAMYSATKAAQKGLAYALVPEFGSAGITFNTIEPGVISTPMTVEIVGTEELRRPFLAHHPNGRVGVPADVAHAALMFADEDAGHLNGQSIMLDGGNTRTAKHSALPPS